jgi:hypothetical protein
MTQTHVAIASTFELESSQKRAVISGEEYNYDGQQTTAVVVDPRLSMLE